MTHGWMHNSIIYKHAKAHYSRTIGLENRAILVNYPFFNIFSRQMSVISPDSEGVKNCLFCISNFYFFTIYQT